MKRKESIIYISFGNLPSKLASSIQVAKMSQALAKKVDDFELVTSGDIMSSIRRMDAEFQQWYAINHKFKLLRIPVHLKTKYPFPKNYFFQSNVTLGALYSKLAVLYAYIKSPTFVYTRSARIVAPLLKLGIPTLWERHEPLPEKLPEDHIYRRFFESKYFVGFVTISPIIAENYIKNGLSQNKILISHSGVDTSLFLNYKSKSLAREQLSQAQDENIVVYGGHLYEYKGISTILDTASLMPKCKFILVGGWHSDIERVKESCLNRNLRNVEVIGHVQSKRLALYLYAADILLLPTSKQWKLAQTTSPMKLFEYMASRRPIVASALPNIMTVLRDRENAFLAEPDEPLSFQKAIEELLKNPTLADLIADQAFKEVDSFSWDSRAGRILEFTRERIRNIKTDHCSNPKKN